MCREDEIAVLAEKLQSRYGNITARSDYAWDWPPLNVLDCVLSLNRVYEPMKQRVHQFQMRQPSIVSLRGLTDLIEAYASPLEFITNELNYRDAGRAETILGVTQYLMKAELDHRGTTEQERLAAWASSVGPTDYESVDVRGFGLAGFQYLRMLFGVQTAKPDLYICRYVSDVIGRKVNDWAALELLEVAAARVNLPLREVDGAIWTEAAKTDDSRRCE